MTIRVIGECRVTINFYNGDSVTFDCHASYAPSLEDDIVNYKLNDEPEGAYHEVHAKDISNIFVVPTKITDSESN